jgi:hypothetical protein
MNISRFNEIKNAARELLRDDETKAALIETLIDQAFHWGMKCAAFELRIQCEKVENGQKLT